MARHNSTHRSNVAPMNHFLLITVLAFVAKVSTQLLS
jgi:hypothetical protein